MGILKPWMLHVWAVLIAVILWIQVHGEGEGSLRLDVPVQLQGLPEKMVVVNNLPSEVRITVKGLQARLKTLQAKNIFIPLNVSDLTEPGVTQRPFDLEAVRLPTGVIIEKIQPDHLELQVDRIVTRTVAVKPQFNLPEAWKVQMLSVQPAMAHIQGPEVWLESLSSVDTLPLKLNLTEGDFHVKAEIVVPTGKSVHLEENDNGFMVRGTLSKAAPELIAPAGKGEVQEIPESVDKPDRNMLPDEKASVLEPVPEPATEEELPVEEADVVSQPVTVPSPDVNKE